MENIIIRTAKKQEIPEIIGLLYELGRPRPKEDSDVDEFRKLVKKYLKDSDKLILVAVYNEIEIIGAVSIMFLPRLNQTNLEMYIPELIVQEKYRRKGIGKLLIHACINLAKKKKCHRIRLESGNNRKESHKFYESLGFEYSAKSFTKNLENCE